MAVRMTPARVPDLLELQPLRIDGFAEQQGMDSWLDHLETLSLAMRQRRMTEDQRQRLYGLLESIYADTRSRRHSRSHA
jgi:hypothetical protein